MCNFFLGLDAVSNVEAHHSLCQETLLSVLEGRSRNPRSTADNASATLVFSNLAMISSAAGVRAVFASSFASVSMS